MVKSKTYAVFNVFNHIFMIFVIIATLYPFLYTLSVSLSESSAVLGGKVTFYPIGLNLNTYWKVIRHQDFARSYLNTVLYTVTGVLTSLFMTVIAAYPLSKKNLRGRKVMMKFLLFTMFFGGGLIPNFLLIKTLGFYDSILAIIIPGAISQYNLIIMMTFFQGIPESLEESAAIDGYNPVQILVKIVLPLSKPVIATIILFVSVGIWNDWFSSLMFFANNKKHPIMLFLRNIIVGGELAAKSGPVNAMKEYENISATLKSSSIILVSLPILMVYPFIQKHFVKGVMIGSLKG